MGDYWTVCDDGLSRNGSFVNGSRVTSRRRLIDGDLMRFGDTVIAYCDPERGESRATADEDEVPTVRASPTRSAESCSALCRPYKNSGGFAAPASNL